MNMGKVVTFAMLGAVAVSGLGACAPAQHPSPGIVAADDPALAARVRDALSTGGLDASQISVSTAQGIVLLTGFARDQQTIERAEVIARRVPGVAGVKSDLQLIAGGPERRR